VVAVGLGRGLVGAQALGPALLELEQRAGRLCRLLEHAIQQRGEDGARTRSRRSSAPTTSSRASDAVGER
jgi:hypothetical protein